MIKQNTMMQAATPSITAQIKHTYNAYIDTFNINLKYQHFNINFNFVFLVSTFTVLMQMSTFSMENIWG